MGRKQPQPIPKELKGNKPPPPPSPPKITPPDHEREMCFEWVERCEMLEKKCEELERECERLRILLYSP